MLHVSNVATFDLVDRTFFLVCLFGSDVLLQFDCFGVVLLVVAFSQHQPAHIVAHFDGFEPSQFDLVSTDGVHPFDGLLR